MVFAEPRRFGGCMDVVKPLCKDWIGFDPLLQKAHRDGRPAVGVEMIDAIQGRDSNNHQQNTTANEE